MATTPPLTAERIAVYDVPLAPTANEPNRRRWVNLYFYRGTPRYDYFQWRQDGRDQPVKGCQDERIIAAAIDLRTRLEKAGLL